MRQRPRRNRPQAIKCRARIAGIFCRKTQNAVTAAIGCAAQHKPRKAKPDAVAVMFSIVPGLGHIYKGHIFAGLLWMIGAIPVGIFVFLAAFASAGWGLGLFFFYLAAAMLHAYGIDDRVYRRRKTKGRSIRSLNR